jgi:hypothetical protein
MSDPSSPPPPKPPARSRKKRIVFSVILLLLVGVPVGVCVYLVLAAGWRLREAVAEADRLDPAGWRLEQLEAQRAVLPDDRNAAAAVIAAGPLLPRSGWPPWEFPDPMGPPDALKESFDALAPPQLLAAPQAAALERELKPVAPALAAARRLADLPEGRYPITYTPDYITTLIPHQQDARVVATLLKYDAMRRAQDRDLDGALESCRALVNAGRSIGDEPMTVSQLVRLACRATAVQALERTLAQGQPSEAALLTTQRLLEKEEAEPLELIAARGERAGMDRLLQALQSGQVPLSRQDLQLTAAFSGPGSGAAPTTAESWILHAPGNIESQRAAMLRCLTQYVEIAKLPAEQQPPRIAQLEATLKDQPVLVRVFCPAMGKIAASCQRSRAQLRCAAAATAAERYRLAQNRWPDSPDALVSAGYLSAVPTDPYDGKPLRWRRLDDGVVIYSIGPDGEDNGGKLDRNNPTAAGTDLGFRLWDVSRHRQPPPPPPGG